LLLDTTRCNWLVEPFPKGTAFDIAHFGAQKDFSKYFFWELICFEFCEIGTKFSFFALWSIDVCDEEGSS